MYQVLEYILKVSSCVSYHNLKNESYYCCADLKVAVMWFFIVCDSIIFNRNSSKQVSPKLKNQFYFLGLLLIYFPIFAYFLLSFFLSVLLAYFHN